VSQGKNHKYIGMTLDYSVPGQVKITMLDYVDEILAAFDKAEPKGRGTKTSAAPDSLFKVKDKCEKLAQSKAVEFHNLVANTLYATKRARPDTCTAIALLTTRVREPDKDDWTKLVHLMRYIRGTRTMPLIPSANGIVILKWWVDASFDVHPDMRGHSGGGLSLGRGFPIVSSTKQKLNTRSSTETEIVGADGFMPAICWTRYFMKAQGYGVKYNVLFQDNKSSIFLEKNGKASISKRTKHINIRYFFITDRVKKEEISVVWCPTGDMIGDFATKPLQVALLCKFRDQIMGVAPARDPGHGKTDSNVGKIKNKPNKGKAKRVVPPGKKVAPQECVGSLTRDCSKVKPGLMKKISDPQDLVIFNKARKKCSQFLISQEGRLKSHPSFTSLLHNNLFRETVFSILHLVRKQENRDYIVETTKCTHFSTVGQVLSTLLVPYLLPKLLCPLVPILTRRTHMIGFIKC
jgi:hypothetical protein